MNKSKFIVALLLICAMCVGGSVAVFASTAYEGDTMVIRDALGSDVVVPFTDADYLYLYNGSYRYFLTNPRVDKKQGDSYVVKGDKSFCYTDGNWVYSGVLSHLPTQQWSYVITCDVFYDSDLVFQKTVVPVVGAVRNLPDQVLPMIKTIVIVGIGGLALVIGFLILPKKLWLFLRG